MQMFLHGRVVCFTQNDTNYDKISCKGCDEIMSLISCTSGCLHQQDGYCGLEHATACSVVVSLNAVQAAACVHFTPNSNIAEKENTTPAFPLTAY